MSRLGVSTGKCLYLQFYKLFILEAGGKQLAGNMGLGKSKHLVASGHSPFVTKASFLQKRDS